MDKIEVRNQKVYVVISGEDWFEPRIISGFYLTDCNPELIVTDSWVEKWNDCYIYNDGYRKVTFHIVGEYPEFSEFYPIKPPKKKGYHWKEGEWKKI